MRLDHLLSGASFPFSLPDGGGRGFLRELTGVPVGVSRTLRSGDPFGGCDDSGGPGAGGSDALCSSERAGLSRASMRVGYRISSGVAGLVRVGV